MNPSLQSIVDAPLHPLLSLPQPISDAQQLRDFRRHLRSFYIHTLHDSIAFSERDFYTNADAPNWPDSAPFVCFPNPHDATLRPVFQNANDGAAFQQFLSSPGILMPSALERILSDTQDINDAICAHPDLYLLRHHAAELQRYNALSSQFSTHCKAAMRNGIIPRFVTPSAHLLHKYPPLWTLLRQMPALFLCIVERFMRNCADSPSADAGLQSALHSAPQSLFFWAGLIPSVPLARLLKSIALSANFNHSLLDLLAAVQRQGCLEAILRIPPPYSEDCLHAFCANPLLADALPTSHWPNITAHALLVRSLPDQGAQSSDLNLCFRRPFWINAKHIDLHCALFYGASSLLPNAILANDSPSPASAEPHPFVGNPDQALFLHALRALPMPSFASAAATQSTIIPKLIHLLNHSTLSPVELDALFALMHPHIHCAIAASQDLSPALARRLQLICPSAWARNPFLLLNAFVGPDSTAMPPIPQQNAPEADASLRLFFPSSASDNAFSAHFLHFHDLPSVLNASTADAFAAHGVDQSLLLCRYLYTQRYPNLWNRMVSSPYWQVRAAIALNPWLPTQLRPALNADPHPVVRSLHARRTHP